MQPIGNRPVPSMLAAGANRKLTLVRIFVKMNGAIPTVYLFHQLFYSFNHPQRPLTKD